MIKQITEPALYQKVIKTEEYCDKCLKEIPYLGAYDVNECRIEHTIGNNWPEGNIGEVFTVDLCPSCTNELFNWLKNNNYRINEREM